MKVVELREKSKDELLKMSDELKASIHQRKMEVAMNTSQNNGEISKMKKELARIMTIINEENEA